MFKKNIKAVVTTFIAAACFSAHAGIVYNNGLPDAVSGNETTAWLQAEDFSIASGATITSATVYLGAVGTWDGTMSYSIFGDVGGAPGALLASGNALNITSADSGISWCCGGNALTVNFDINPFAAIAGTTYWFGIHASPDFARDDVYWVTTSGGASNGHESSGGTLDNWFDNGQEHAFSLSSTGGDVPEPASLALLGLGLAGVAATRRRKAA